MLRRPEVKLRRKVAEKRHPCADTHTGQHVSHTKPFSKVSFYLDLKDYHNLKNLTNEILTLGGAVETFLSKEINYVVTNRPNWKQQIRDGAKEDGSLPSTPNSLSTTKSGIINDPHCNLETPVESNPIKTIHSRSSAILEKARRSTHTKTKGSSDVLQIARMWGVNVLSLASLINAMTKFKLHKIDRPMYSKDIRRLKSSMYSAQKTNLTNPFVKVEDANSVYRPHYRQFGEWPVLNFSTDHTQSPFAKEPSKKSTHKALALKQKRQSTHLPSSKNHCSPEPSGPLENVASAALQVLNPSTGSTYEAKKAKVVLKPGFCEMCAMRYQDVYEHVKEKEHQILTNRPEYYGLLDKKIAELTNILTLANWLAQRPLDSRPSRYKQSDVISDNDGRNAKKNFNMPLPKVAFQKRKYHLGSSELSRKKLKVLIPLSGTSCRNIENLRPDSSKTELVVFKQLSELLPKPKNLEQSHAEHVTVSKDLFVEPLKRKALETLDRNAVKPNNFESCQSQDSSKWVKIQIPSSAEKPESVRLLRSTALRRVSVSQPSANSPSLRSSVFGELLDSRKVQSSPSVSVATKKRRLFGVRRSLDLGSGKVSHDAGVKSISTLKRLQCEANSDIDCLEAALDAPLSPLTTNTMPCLLTISPTLDPKNDFESRELPTLDCETDGIQAAACSLFHKEDSDNSCHSIKRGNAIDAVELSGSGAVRETVDSVTSLCTVGTAKGLTAAEKASEKSKRVESGINSCSVGVAIGLTMAGKSESAMLLGCIEESVQAVNPFGSSKSEIRAHAFTEVKMPNSNLPLDLTCKRVESGCLGNAKNRVGLTYHEDGESRCSSNVGVAPLVPDSPSSVFNLISSPVLCKSSRASDLTETSATPRSESSIPKVIFKRVRGEKQMQWTVQLLSEGPRVT